MMNSNDYSKTEYTKCLPTIRLQKVEINNFKNVEHGEIIFNCAREKTAPGTQSDILGLYGQNGSGKTSFVDAMCILRRCLLGERLLERFAECVAKDADHARLVFVFDLQYPDGRQRTVSYELSLKAVPDRETSQEMISSVMNENGGKIKPVVFDEVLRMAGHFENKKVRLQPVIDMSKNVSLFLPESKVKTLLPNVTQKTVIDFASNKKLAQERATSQIFLDETIGIFAEYGYSEYFQVILELRYFATYFFYIVTTDKSGIIRANLGIPFYTREGILTFDVNKSNTLPDYYYTMMKDQLDVVNVVVKKLIPGLSIHMKEAGTTVLQDGKPGHMVELTAVRNGKELPIRCLSDGVRRLISMLNLLVTVYNEQSCTVVIDEFDAGIFEYLLGEILQLIESSGRGQFIFTSHNLRPLEVIRSKYLYFTTTNPKNRYIQFKGVKSSSNLRKLYFRDILLGGQDEEMYESGQQFEIAMAFHKAGSRKKEQNGKG